MTTNEINQLARAVSEKKRYLAERVAAPMADIARECIQLLQDADRLDQYLQQAILQLPQCARVYVADRTFCQCSSTVTTDASHPEFRGQDLSKNRYLQDTIPLKGLVLTTSYADTQTTKSCVTLIQAMQDNNELHGLVIADFRLDDVPVPNDFTRMVTNWHQFKGDPAIRGGLFNQKRIGSYLDKHLIQTHDIVLRLMIQFGVFHFKLHYSSSRVTLWLYDQPHHYRLHNVEDLINGSVFECYPQRDYPDDACVSPHQLVSVLRQFRELRYADENIYLRSGSVNIINGIVGLNFSCDGSHYIPVPEFIDNSMDYWLGSLKAG